MIIKPVITEKSLSEAKEGNYTFYVDKRFNKNQIRMLVESTFDVTVTKVRTINVKGENKRNSLGKKKIVKSSKKAIVTLGEKDSIDLFDEKKKMKKGKKK
jgi:large subunit ribosomal protein L23